MGGAKLVGRAVWSPKCDRNVELAARHHQHVRRVVHHLIESNERKTEGHELDDRPEPDHGGADTESGETIFTDWGVNDALRSETLEQTLAYFVSAMVFRDFLTHQKHVRVPLQFFGERFVERLAISNLPHPFPPLKYA